MRLAVTFLSFSARITQLFLSTEESRIHDAVFTSGPGGVDIVLRQGRVRDRALKPSLDGQKLA